MSPRTDVLIIDADLLLDYRRVSLDTYESVGVDPKTVKNEPYKFWLPSAVGSMQLAMELQTARDGRLVERLFSKGVKELSALDVVHLFVEAGGHVLVVSHETPDALLAIMARAGLPDSVQSYGMIPHDQRSTLVSSVAQLYPDSWHVVYQLGLTSRQEQRIVEVLRGRGIFVNVSKLTATAEAEDQILRIIFERWSYE